MSEGLEALKEIKICNYYEDDEYIDDDYLSIGEYINIIEKELKRLEEIDKVMILNNKNLNTLEIIKEIGINVMTSGEEYYLAINDNLIKKISKEKFDLLKEGLL